MKIYRTKKSEEFASQQHLIQPTEEEEMNLLLHQIDYDLNKLLDKAEERAYEIGGYFRGPGNKVQLKEMLKEIINQF